MSAGSGRPEGTEQEPDTPSSRWERFIERVLVVYSVLWILALLAWIGMRINHDPSADTYSARWNTGLCMLGLVLLITWDVRRRWLLRPRWRRLLIVGLHAFVLACTYDGVAHILPAHLLPTLDQIVPGLAQTGRDLLLVISVLAALATHLEQNRNQSAPHRVPPPTT